jgi:hypothetical protein
MVFGAETEAVNAPRRHFTYAVACDSDLLREHIRKSHPPAGASRWSRQHRLDPGEDAEHVGVPYRTHSIEDTTLWRIAFAYSSTGWPGSLRAFEIAALLTSTSRRPNSLRP